MWDQSGRAFEGVFVSNRQGYGLEPEGGFFLFCAPGKLWEDRSLYKIRGPVCEGWEITGVIMGV